LLLSPEVHPVVPLFVFSDNNPPDRLHNSFFPPPPCLAAKSMTRLAPQLICPVCFPHLCPTFFFSFPSLPSFCCLLTICSLRPPSVFSPLFFLLFAPLECYFFCFPFHPAIVFFRAFFRLTSPKIRIFFPPLQGPTPPPSLTFPPLGFGFLSAPICFGPPPFLHHILKFFFPPPSAPFSSPEVVS